MPSASELYESGRYLKATDLTLGQRRIAIIHSAEVRQVPDTRNPGQNKTMLALSLTSASGHAWPKELLLNKTNTLQIVAAYGDDYSFWPGKPVEIWSENTAFQGRIVAGLKVMPKPGGNGQPAMATPPVAPPPPSATAMADLPPISNPNMMPNWKPPQEHVPDIDDDSIPF